MLFRYSTFPTFALIIGKTLAQCEFSFITCLLQRQAREAVTLHLAVVSGFVMMRHAFTPFLLCQPAKHPLRCVRYPFDDATCNALETNWSETLLQEDQEELSKEVMLETILASIIALFPFPSLGK